MPPDPDPHAQPFDAELDELQEQLDTFDERAKETRAKTPDEALRLLMEGHKRYVAESAERPNQSVERRLSVANEQRPFAVIFGCADSRVPPEILFDYGLGDLFIVRVAGNVADDAAIGSVEFAAAALEVPLVMVLGHGGCGAVRGALHAAKSGEEVPGYIGKLLSQIVPAVRACAANGGTLSDAIRANVRATVRRLSEAQPTLARLVKAGKLRVVGAYYDMASGEIELLDGVQTPQ